MANDPLNQSSNQSIPPEVERANSFTPKQSTSSGGIILTGPHVEMFKWNPSSDSGNISFIPDNLKEINKASSFSLESPSGTPKELIPDPPLPQTLSNQTGSLSTDSGFDATQARLNQNLPPGVYLYTNQTEADASAGIIPQEQKPEGQKNSQESKTIGNLPRINSFFEPKLIPQNISINIQDLTKVDQEKIRQDLGFTPFIWYSDIQIEYRDIKFFTLKYDNSIPTINLSFNDSFGIMKKRGFPADDTLITVFFNSRSKNLRSIKMDFKVYTFKDFKDGSYSITGIADIPLLYTRKFQSYPRMSSHEVLRDVAKSIGCGFCSNIGDTNDRQTWINTGESSLNFTKSVLMNSYISDDTFLFCYIDFYYNLCYVDINKELTRDIDRDVMVNSAGFDKVKAEGDQGEERLIPIALSNDPSYEGSNAHISSYKILNNSTRISIFNSYRTRSESWNYAEKEFNQFDIETITPEGDDVILLKGRPEDSLFFRENSNTIWTGKGDTDNTHPNYNYSTLQNKLNLDELSKIGATLTLSTANLNLYLFQKIKVIFSVKKQTPTNEEQFMVRLSGDWMIVGIELRYSNGRNSQVLNVIKTSLGLTPEEAEKSVSPKERTGEDPFERNNNPIDDTSTTQEITGSNPIIGNCGGPGRKEDKNLKIRECENCLGTEFTNLIQGFAAPLSFAGQKIQTVEELEKIPIRPNEDVKAEILPILNSPEYLSKYTKGHRMFALVWTMKEGYNGPKSGKSISRSYRTKNPGNIGNTDSGNNKEFGTIKEGLDYLMNFLKKVSLGDPSIANGAYKFGPKTIRPTWSNEVANNPNAYGRYYNGDRNKPIGCLPGYTGDYRGQLGAFSIIYSTFSRVSNGSISKLSAIFRINGFNRKIDGNTTLGELISFNDSTPINFDFKK